MGIRQLRRFSETEKGKMKENMEGALGTAVFNSGHDRSNFFKKC